MISGGAYRRAVVLQARREYIQTGATKNITTALAMLCKDRPEICAPIKQRLTGREADRPPTILDEYERPACRKCGAPMYWKNGCSLCRGRVKKNRWICKDCGFIRYTKRTLKEEIQRLKRKTGESDA